MGYKDELPAIEDSFDQISKLPPHKWSHNRHYHRTLLREVNQDIGGIAVDVGCGVGELTRALSPSFKKVLGIDISECMLQKAREASVQQSNIEYVKADFIEYELPESGCGCIVSAASLHHFSFEESLRKAKRSLKRGGRLLVVDIYQPSTLMDVLASVAATYISKIFIILFDRRRMTEEERAVWRAHGALDTYMTLPEIRKTAKDMLPGAVVRRRLFWRYTLVWVKP